MSLRDFFDGIKIFGWSKRKLTEEELKHIEENNKKKQQEDDERFSSFEAKQKELLKDIPSEKLTFPDHPPNYVDVSSTLSSTSVFSSTHSSNTPHIPVKVTEENGDEWTAYMDSAIFGGIGGIAEATIGLGGHPGKGHEHCKPPYANCAHNEVPTQTDSKTSTSDKNGGK